jgi:hypothetical protein
MHGPTCIFWANLIPFSLQGMRSAVLDATVAKLDARLELNRKAVQARL